MMLQNMKLGTKLLAVILPPLIVLVIVAGLGARDRLNTAADARSAREYVELGLSASAVTTTMQWERNAALYILSGGTDEEYLTIRRGRTDDEFDKFAIAAERVRESGDASLVAMIDRSLQRRSELASFRGAIDAGTTDVWIIQDFFARANDDHLNLISELSNTVPVIEVSGELASFSALARAKESASRTTAALTIALTQGEFDASGRLWRATRDAESGFDRYVSLFYDISPNELSSTLRGALGSPVSQRAEDLRLQVVNDIALTINIFGDGAALGDPLRLNHNPAEWVDRSEARLNSMNVVGHNLVVGVWSFVDNLQRDAEQTALLYLLATAAAVLLSGILAVVVARRVTRPLRELTDAADRLSGEQIPALVERLRSPSSTVGGVLLEPIGMKRNDEIGHLADAFDAIQRVTVEVAEEQASLLRKGIGDIFVNLARRNQTLLDRQIEFIDQLESSEEDPDVLENLFKLDHLATRMRRNAESLLVLAGVETGHRRSRPVPLPDVVRVAIGEVEDFARLNLLALDDAMISGTAAMDVAHLLSELMENATAFSPPETHVEILGHSNSEGAYVISISDQGIGMSEEQFAEANRLLADPPLVGLTLSRSLGFTVVGRLAKRFDISVRLTSSPTGGVTALVTLPTSILQSHQISVAPDAAPAVEAAAPAPAPAPTFEPTPQPTFEPTPQPTFDSTPQPTFDSTPQPTFDSTPQPTYEPTPQPTSGFGGLGGPVRDEPAPAEQVPAFEERTPVFDLEPDAPRSIDIPAIPDISLPQPDLPRPSEPAPDWVAPAPASSTLASAVPEGAAFDAGLAALMGEDTSAPTTDDERSAPSGPSAPPAPSIFNDAAILSPSDSEVNSEGGGITSAGLERRVPRANTPVDEHTERPGTSTSVAASQRSPEEVRAMLSRYRSGLQRANQPGDGNPSGSGSDGTN
jgi:signal transduction histidine kinase